MEEGNCPVDNCDGEEYQLNDGLTKWCEVHRLLNAHDFLKQTICCCMAVCFHRDFTFSLPATQRWTKHDCLLYLWVRHPLEWCCNEVQNLLPSVWTPGFCSNIRAAAYMLHGWQLYPPLILANYHGSYRHSLFLIGRLTVNIPFTWHFYTYYIKVATQAMSDIRAVRIKMWL